MTEKFDSCKDWTFAEIDDAYSKIQQIAEEKFGLTYYPNQIEIITSEQMLDAYSAVGMPIYYSHWSFGKQFVAESERYKRGQMGLAYEIVINSNPCISYLMEENTMMMQCLVMAHACFGHNSFFANNTHFQQWTDASAIIDYLAYAKKYIADCEEKHGEAAVEQILTAAHALRDQGVDRYKRPKSLSKKEQEARDKARHDHEQSIQNELWRTIPVTVGDAKSGNSDAIEYLKDPEENLLYFIEKHSPTLKDWEREIVRIVRKVSQYFYPQRLTQIMNEGWATFTHYNIMQEMYERGWVTDGFMLEFHQYHTNVVYQHPGAQINPYALGFAMFNDIKRICTDPTDEDRAWFPELAGVGNWLEHCKYAAYNFKDEAFILQYLSPKVIRDFGLFYLLDDDRNDKIHVKAIQNEEGYKTIREKLSDQQNVNNRLPRIEVIAALLDTTRELILRHHVFKDQQLELTDAGLTMYYIHQLWGFYVSLQSGDKVFGADDMGVVLAT